MQDKDFHRLFLTNLYEEAGFDLRRQAFDPFFVADLTGASSVTSGKNNQLMITIWRPGEGERVTTLD
ncbi:hypothetical protein ABN034_23890 [Actinopolymorpha sp. B11F2]|uniref:hypothetical protein n=1 Tax=Actinopolymorpha sp. B11F2 TaxID=3160862 RepID=UPI0032E4D767